MILIEVLVQRNVWIMEHLMQISHPSLFFIPIMALSLGLQFLRIQRRKRGLAPQDDWTKVAMVVLLVALCLLGVFAKFG